MKRFVLAVGTSGLLIVLAAGSRAQAPATPPAAPTATPSAPADWKAWAWYLDVPLPEFGDRGYGDFVLPPAVFTRSRLDLADLRLADAQGREVPFALRIRRARDEEAAVSFREFNRSRGPENAAQVSLDLGADPGEHNEVEVVTPGTEFRRRVRVEGSENGQQWATLVARGHVARFPFGGQTVEQKRLSYPVSRHRYLRISVLPDTVKPDDHPTVSALAVFRTRRLAGEFVSLPLTVSPREPVRVSGQPGSRWDIEFNGETVPVEEVLVSVENDSFVRSYRLSRVAPPVEEADGGATFDRFLAPEEYPVTSGAWQRRAGEPKTPLRIEFPEVNTRRLRLTVVDASNPPLALTGVECRAPARQIVFARTPDLAGPLRLYFGYPKAAAPQYDFAANLPTTVEAARTAAAGEVRPNPEYQPDPKPWTERWPWLIYVVLGAASAVLLALLVLLARQAIRRADAAAAPTPARSG
jgi:hypothetical protein